MYDVEEKSSLSLVRAICEENRSLIVLKIENGPADWHDHSASLDADVARLIVKRHIVLISDFNGPRMPLTVAASCAIFVRTNPFIYRTRLSHPSHPLMQIARDNWFRSVPLLSFIRANRYHPFRYSVLPLLSMIRDFAAEVEPEQLTSISKPTNQALRKPIKFDRFIDSKFAQSIVATSFASYTLQNKQSKRKSME
jgi:hypothetical protein